MKKKALNQDALQKLLNRKTNEKLGEELCRILINYTGERGQNEGAVECLHRIIAERDKGRQPIPMRLVCPECKTLHIDEGDFETKRHHTHACQNCGNVWRPAVVATVGVKFLPGFKNLVWENKTFGSSVTVERAEG